MPAPFVCGDQVAEATRLAAEGMAFTVSWCPRRGAEFVLPCKEVDEACRREWKLGMRVTCDTGVVRPGVVHEELPHKLMSKQGTIRVINDYLWQKLDVEWDVQRPSSSGSTARSAVVSHSLRLFGVDIVP
ncbi:auxin response factor 13-like [Lolium perenne]|uniref:auxin response factor 13-like n=1 Tax=Lolium perenne TaxID=4522 RepID=UPI0021F69ADB|nr:auxin response factor 13-like [Lolium perenne]